MGVVDLMEKWYKIDTEALAEQVLSQWDVPEYAISYNPNTNTIRVGMEPFFLAQPNIAGKTIEVELLRDWNPITAWAIPYKGKLSAKKMIKAIKACINVYETEEIE